MQALVLHGVGDARYGAVPRPGVPAGWVLVRVAFCGVCGSDIPRVFVKGTYRFPTICGHEFAGTVAETGSSVDDYAIGDRVAVFPLLWCGKCAACEQGRYVQCEDYDYLGSRRDGAFAEYVAAPRQNLLRVPDGVSFEEAAMTEPAAVALHALRRGGCKAGDAAAIFGAGPIGLMAAQWARIMGASRILIFDIDPAKLDIARRCGFANLYNSAERNPVDVIREVTAGRGAHIAIEAAGVPQTTVQALDAVRDSGRVVLLGNPSGDVTLPAALISRAMRREITIAGTWNSTYSARGGDDDWRTALDAMASGALRLKPLITHIVPLDQAWETLKNIRGKAGVFSKVLIQP